MKKLKWVPLLHETQLPEGGSAWVDRPYTRGLRWEWTVSWFEALPSRTDRAKTKREAMANAAAYAKRTLSRYYAKQKKEEKKA